MLRGKGYNNNNYNAILTGRNRRKDIAVFQHLSPEVGRRFNYTFINDNAVILLI